MAFDMKDRLGQLKHVQQGRYEDDFVPTESSLQALEGEGDFMQGFFATVDELTKMVNQISVHVDQIKHNHNVILASFQNQATKDETETLMDEVKRTSHRIHNGLKKLKQQIEAEQEGPERNTADFRIKKAQYSTLSRKFTEVMADYNQVQEEYREKCKDRITRQLKYTGKRVTEDEVEEMLESDNPAVFTKDILIDTAQKRQALGEIEARHQEILHLEENIKELHDMFYDMAILVEEQGEMIDLIEHNVELAAAHVEVGQQNIRRAAEYSRSNRRLKCIICMVITGVVVVILVIILIIVLVVVCMSGRCS